MPDTTSIRPVPSHARGGEQGRHGLVKKEVVIDQLLLLSVSHLAKGIVFPCSQNTLLNDMRPLYYACITINHGAQ